MNDRVLRRDGGLSRVMLGAVTLTLLILSWACGSKARPGGPTERAAFVDAGATAVLPAPAAPPGSASPPPADLPESLLHWAGDEPTAIVMRGDALIARAMNSGRTRTLRAAATRSALLDPEFDLLWIQGPTTLDVLDLRAEGAPVPIAITLPTGPRIQINRKLGGKSVHLASPDVCVQASDLFLDWTSAPQVRLIGGDSEEEKQATDPASLVGRAWLRAQAGRAQRPSRPVQRDFSFAKPAPKAARIGVTCTTSDQCGTAIPFDGASRLLVIVEYSMGDCQHYGCRLYEPATQRFATPPAASSWGPRANVPTGPCGLYRFDRSGRRFLVGDQACAVGGACEDLGGEASGWLVPGADVGTDG